MVNYIRLARKLACMWRPYRTCNSTVVFSKYEFNNKLLDGVTLLKIILGITWIQPYIYIYIYNEKPFYILEMYFFFKKGVSSYYV